MVETDCVPDLVGDREAHVVDVEVAIEADLPRPKRIEADQRLPDRADSVRARACVLPERHVCEGPAACLGVGADQDARVRNRRRLHEDNIGRPLPDREGGTDLPAESDRIEARRPQGGLGRQHRVAVACARKLRRLREERVADRGGKPASGNGPADVAPPELEQTEFRDCRRGRLACARTRPR